MKTSAWRSAAIVATLASALLLSACGGGTDEGEGNAGDTVAGATEPVVVYSGRAEELVGSLFEEFTAETGIPVEVRYGDTA